jgi:hypothetical protein
VRIYLDFHQIANSKEQFRVVGFRVRPFSVEHKFVGKTSTRTTAGRLLTRRHLAVCLTSRESLQLRLLLYNFILHQARAIGESWPDGSLLGTVSDGAEWSGVGQAPQLATCEDLDNTEPQVNRGGRGCGHGSSWHQTSL